MLASILMIKSRYFFIKNSAFENLLIEVAFLQDTTKKYC